MLRLLLPALFCLMAAALPAAQAMGIEPPAPLPPMTIPDVPVPALPSAPGIPHAPVNGPQYPAAPVCVQAVLILGNCAQTCVAYYHAECKGRCTAAVASDCGKDEVCTVKTQVACVGKPFECGLPLIITGAGPVTELMQALLMPCL